MTEANARALARIVANLHYLTGEDVKDAEQIGAIKWWQTASYSVNYRRQSICNAVIDFARLRKYRPISIGRQSDDDEELQPDGDDIFAAVNLRLCIEAAMVYVPQSHHEMLALTAQGYTPWEISQILKLPLVTITKRLYESRKILRKYVFADRME